MRTTHRKNHTRKVALGLSATLLVAGLLFAFAPGGAAATARAAFGAQLSANPVTAKLLAWAPAALRGAIAPAKAVDAEVAPATALTITNFAPVSVTPTTVAAGSVLPANPPIFPSAHSVELVWRMTTDGNANPAAGNTVFTLPFPATWMLADLNAQGNHAGAFLCAAGNPVTCTAANPLGVAAGTTDFNVSLLVPATENCGTVMLMATLESPVGTPVAGSPATQNVVVTHSIDLNPAISVSAIAGNAGGVNPVGQVANVFAGPGRISARVQVIDNGPSEVGPNEAQVQIMGLPAGASIQNVATELGFVGGCLPPVVSAGPNTVVLTCTSTAAFGPGPAPNFDAIDFEVVIPSNIEAGTPLNIIATTSTVPASCATDPVAANNMEDAFVGDGVNAANDFVVANTHDLQVLMTGTPAATFAGGLIQYDVAVRNIGVFTGVGGVPGTSSNAYGFVVTGLLDILPSPAQGIAELISLTPAANFSCTPMPAPGPLPFGAAPNAPNMIICTFNNPAGLAPGAANAPPVPAFTAVVKVGANFDPADVIPDVVDTFAAVDANPASAGIRIDPNGGSQPPNMLPPNPFNPAAGQVQGNNLVGVNTTISVAADLGTGKISLTRNAVVPNPPQSVIAGGVPSGILTTLNEANNPNTNGPGDVTYLITYSNAGPGDARNVVFEDAVPGNPAELLVAPPIFGNATLNGVPINVIFGPTGSAGNFAVSCEGVGVGNTIVCNPTNNTALNPSYVAGVFPRNLTFQMAYRIRVRADANPGSLIANSSRITSTPNNPGNPPGPPSNPSTPDPNAGNNTSLPTSNVIVTQADMQLTKVLGAPTANPPIPAEPMPVAGNPAAIAYTLTVTNNGFSDARNSAVMDALPPGVVFVSATADKYYTCTGPPTGTNGVVTCTAGIHPAPDLTGGDPTRQIAMIIVIGRVAADAAAGLVTNSATVTAETRDPGPALNTGQVQQTIVVNAPLTVTLDDTPDPVCAGDNLVYHISVTNNGPSTAQGVVVRLPLPANTTFVSLNATNGLAGKCAYSQVGNTVICSDNVNLAGINALGALNLIHDLNVTVKVDAAAPAGPLNATATITTITGQVVVGQDTETTTVLHCADLEITKSDTPDAVLPGGVINYTIRVRNIGPSTLGLGEARVTDTFNVADFAQLTGGAITAPGFNCSVAVATQTFTCDNDNATIPPGSSLTITFPVTVNANFNNGQPGGAVDNTAAVSLRAGGADVACPPDPIAQVGNLRDANCGNNTSATATPVGPNADLQLTKIAAPASVIAGDLTAAGVITYTITYRNNGPGDALAVTITDTVPANTIAVGGIVAAGLTCTPAAPVPGQQFSCTPTAGGFGANAAGTLPANTGGTITFQVRVPANVAQNTIVTNGATITSTTPDPNNSNNTQNATSTLVNTSADLSIVKAQLLNTPPGPNVGPQLAGNNITYTLTVMNNAAAANSGSDAQNVVITDVLNANLEFISATSSNNSFTCSPGNQGGQTTVTCNAATLPAGGQTVITIVAKVKSNTPNGTNISNTGTVASTTADPNPANNTSTVQTVVATNAVVSITKSDQPDPVVAGTNLTYLITISNAGPSDALNVNLTDTLPVGVDFVSFSGTGILQPANACNHVGNTVTCGQPPATNANLTLAAGGSATLTIVGKVLPSVLAGTVLTNTATVTWTDGTGNQAANTATTTTTTAVIHNSDLSIRKEAPDFVIAGQRLDYRLIIANAGPSDVSGDEQLPPPGVAIRGSIIVTDLLPVGLTLANVPNNLFVAPGGPGGFLCTATVLVAPDPNAGRTRIICDNAGLVPGNFPVGANLEIIIKVQLDQGLLEGQNLINCAQVSVRNAGATPENDLNGGGTHGLAPGNAVIIPASGNNESCDSTVVRTAADLGVSKTANAVADPDGAGGPLVAVPLPGPNSPPGAVAAGGYIRYDVPFGNAGPSDAVNVRLTDVIAGNTAFVGALIPVPVANTFTPAVQPPVLPFTFTIQATFNGVAPVAGRPAINLNCTVSSNSGSNQITCTPNGNVVQPPAAGDPNYAAGVLPAGYRGTLTFFVKVNESVTGGTLVANPANITSAPSGNSPGTPDPNPGNNTSLPTSTLVVANSQLAITKALLNPTFAAVPPAAANSLIPGTQYTYRIILTNNGPSDVATVRVIDTIPVNARYLSINQVAIAAGVLGVGDPGINFAATFTCAPPTGINDPAGNGGQVQCTAPILSANTPNNRAAFEFTVLVDPSTKANVVNNVAANGTINNFNTPVSAAAQTTNPVGPTSDIVTTKSHLRLPRAPGEGPLPAAIDADPTISVAGRRLQYTLTIRNNGPSTAAMINLTDTLPPFQALASPSNAGDPAPPAPLPPIEIIGAPANFSCTPNTAGAAGPINCGNATGANTSSLLPNQQITIRITVLQAVDTPQPTPPQPYRNCVVVRSMSFDPTTAGDGPQNQLAAPDTTADANGQFDNSSICDPVVVAFVADLNGGKVDLPDPVIAGTNLTYTITAGNLGPSAALNFTITDILPLGVSFVSATPSAGGALVAPIPAAGAVGTGVAGGPTVTATWPGLTNPGVVRTLTIVVRVCPDFQQIRNLTDAQMCVPNLTNRAVITSATPANVAPVNADSETTVQAQSDLAITKRQSAPLLNPPANNLVNPSSAAGDSIVDYTLTISNGGPSNANGVVVTDVLPKGFRVITGGVTIASVPDAAVPAANITTAIDAAGQQTVTINFGVLGAANQCTVNRPTTATITIRARVPNKYPNIIVTDTATITSTNCLPETGTLAVQTNPNSGFAALITPGTLMLANNRAFFDTIVGPAANDPGPGTPGGYPATAEVSDQKAGSVLIYPIYTSDAANPNTQNTRVNLTNTSNTETATVHLYVVDGSSCAVLDAFICLTPNQTATFLASDFDPGATGYIMAVAVDNRTGLPMAFNCLIGDEYVKFATGHAANLGAEAVAAVMWAPAGIDTTATQTTLRFNGMNYNRLPRVVALDNVGSIADQNSTLVIVNAIGGDYTRSGATLLSLFGNLYDDAETAFSFTQSAPACQFRSLLSNNFPRTFTRFQSAIPAGRTGWIKFASTAPDTFGDSRALIGTIGAAINFNPNATANSGAFNQGHNLHKLTLQPSAQIVVPVLTPDCR